jgi:hypothetical protein
MFFTPARAVRAALATAASLVLVAGIGACSSDDGSDPESTPESSPATTEAAPGIPTKSTIGFVKGKLKPDRRKQLRLRVTKAIDEWIDAAYVAGDYPRNDFSDAFKTFSKGAAALAKRDKGLMSNADVGDRVDTVTAKARRLRIDVLADKGKAAGVTARVVLLLQLDGEVQRTDRIAGRLFLGYGGSAWQVFGYDVKRGRVA